MVLRRDCTPFMLSIFFAAILLSSYVSAKTATDLESQSLRGSVYRVELSSEDLAGTISLTDEYNVRGYRIAAVRSVGKKAVNRSISLYDAKNNLVRATDIAFRNDGSPDEDQFYDCYYTYTAEGDLDQAVSYQFHGTIKQRSVLTYSKGKNGKKSQASEVIYDGSGKPISRRSCAYSYDKKGRLSQEVWTDSSGRTVSKYTYAYDSTGRKTRETAFGSKGAVSHTIAWKYDKAGRLTEEVYKSEGSNWQRRWTYNGSGMETGHTYWQNGTVVQSSQYDSKKKVTELVSYGSGGRLVEVLNTESRVISSVSYTRSGQLVSEKRYAYSDDEKGNWIARTVRITKGQGKGSVSQERRKITYYPSIKGSAVYEALGRVTDGKGKAMPDASVRLSLADGTAKSYRTDKTGIWFADNLKGRVAITVKKPGWEFRSFAITGFSPGLICAGEPVIPQQSPQSVKVAGPVGPDERKPATPVTAPAAESVLPAEMLEAVISLNSDDLMKDSVDITRLRVAPTPVSELPQNSAKAVDDPNGAAVVEAVPETGVAWGGKDQGILPVAGVRVGAKAGRIGASVVWEQGLRTRDVGASYPSHWISLSAQYTAVDDKDMRLTFGGGVIRREYQGISDGVFGEGELVWFPKKDLNLGLDLNTGYRYYPGRVASLDNAYVKFGLSGSSLAILASSVICALVIGIW